MQNKEENQEPSLEEKVRIEMLAERIKLLFQFCTELIPDIDLVRKTAKSASERESTAMTAAPILGAAGIDYEEKQMQWSIRARRAEAIANLLEVLRDTQKDMDEQKAKAGHSAAMRVQINKIFGL